MDMCSQLGVRASRLMDADLLIDRVRLIGPCFVSGHAADVAAAVAARRGVTARQAPVAEIQRVLREQGAYLG